MRHHRHLHARQDWKGGWDRFVNDVEDTADDFNFFKDDEPKPTVVAKAAEPETVYHTVYKTMSKTFEGEIAGWSTVGAAAEPETEAVQPKAQPTPPPQAKSPDDDDDDTRFTVAAENTGRPAAKTTDAPQALATADAEPPLDTAKPSLQSLESLPESVVPTNTKDLEGHTTLAVATNDRETPTRATPTADNTDATAVLGATNSATASSDADASSDGAATSVGAKAGIAFGVLGGILVVGLLVWFLFNKRKGQMEKNQRTEDDEKINGAFGGHSQMQERPERPASVQTARTDATAPQLSLRPVTQFNPTFGERRSSRGAALALNVAAANNAERGPPTNNSLWERPATGNSSHQDNPFRDNAGHVSPANQPSNPFDAPENVVGVATSTNAPPQPSPVGAAMTSEPNTDGAAAAAAAGGAAAAAAGAGLARKTSIRKDAPAPLDLTLPQPMSPVPPSPAGTDFSQSEVAPGQSPGPSEGAAAIAAAGGPASTLVHRVQLDFKPTLEDEMDLKTGQLVRLLHEYDDGWALCIRLDRSKQGVVPRTCLSTRPMKPRPAPGTPRGGPPINPSSPGPHGAPRGPPRGPPGPPGMRPMNGQGYRPMSPAGRPQSPAGMPPGMRPNSPAGGPPMGPYGGRPASPSTGRPMSPGPRAQSPGPRQQRPQSPSYASRRITPPGPSPMNPNAGSPPQGSPQGPPQGPIGRKPVPGQAY